MGLNRAPRMCPRSRRVPPEARRLEPGTSPPRCVVREAGVFPIRVRHSGSFPTKVRNRPQVFSVSFWRAFRFTRLVVPNSPGESCGQIWGLTRPSCSAAIRWRSHTSQASRHGPMTVVSRLPSLAEACPVRPEFWRPRDGGLRSDHRSGSSRSATTPRPPTSRTGSERRESRNQGHEILWRMQCLCWVKAEYRLEHCPETDRIRFHRRGQP